MARLFDDAGSEYLEKDTAPFTAEPFSMACWFYSDDITLGQSLIWVGDKDVHNHAQMLVLSGDQSGDPISAISRDSASITVASTSTGYSANVWHHAAGVWADTDDRAAFIDGGSKGTSGINRSVSGEDRISIGRNGDSTPDGYMSGRIAEAAIWNVALADAEIAALARGIKPNHIRPGNLVLYCPLWGIHGPEIDLSGNGNDLTLNGTGRADHSPVTPFTPKWAAGVPLIEVAAGGGFAHTQAVIIA